MTPCCYANVFACEHAIELHLSCDDALMPDRVKVGWTEDLEARVRKLSTLTGALTPLEIA